MSFLLRTATGIFNLENGIDIETLHRFKEDPDLISKYLLSVDEALFELPKGSVPKKLESKLRNGVRLNLAEYCDASEMKQDRLIRIYIEEEFLGIAKCRGLDPLEVKMEKLFNI
jgi:tRNA pseudouridine55 synthase